MRRILLSLAGLLAVTSLALADGRFDPGFHAAFKAAEQGKRVKLAIGGDTVSTSPLRCGSVDGYEDGIVEVYLKDGEVCWSAVRKEAPAIAPATPSCPTCPSCPNGTCPNVRYYRWR